MGLNGDIVRVSDLSERQINEMLNLMEIYYENVTKEKFKADLLEKHWVILLSRNNGIRGFSTQQLFSMTIDGVESLFLFSGDTIVDKNCWGSGRLPVAGVRLTLSIRADNPGRNLFWLLTTKGYMTYRFLPVFFNRFYPQHATETPALEQRVINVLGRMKWPGRFEPGKGVIKARKNDQRLRSGIADITARKRNDPHISFFEKVNPGHAIGDELVCLARCDESNFKPFILHRANRR